MRFTFFRPEVTVRAGRTSSRGWVLLELMNAVSLLAIVGALSMYFMGIYVARSKHAEALGGVKTMAEQAAAYYEKSDSTQPKGTPPEAAREMRHFPIGSREAVPPVHIIRGKRFQTNPADWGVPPWSDLNFSIHQPQFYSYRFESSGRGRDAKASASAEGDIDGDGENSRYEIALTVNDKFQAIASPPQVREE